MSRPRPHYPTCMFCRKNDSKPSKEDILAKWIAREWPAHKKSRFRYEGGSVGVEAPDLAFENVGNFGLVTTGPCTRCNNGWMSRLEEQAKPIFKPLMRGISRIIPTDEQLTMARWTVKTALLYEYAREAAHNRYFKPANRLALFESLTIPPDTFIYAARYVGSFASRSIGGRVPLVINDQNRATIEAHSSTITIGQLALQVFSFRRPKDYDATLRMTIPGPWEMAQRIVWPIRGNTDWPPPQALDDNGLDLFAGRWLSLAP